jgi:CheY-like chemotaxis protein
LEETVALWGMIPTSVEGGSSALLLLESASNSGTLFPLALIDYMMPGMNGFELVERIRKNPGFSSMKIFILSSTGQRGDASTCLKLGIAGYLCFRQAKKGPGTAK